MSNYKSVDIIGVIQKDRMKSTMCYDTSYKSYAVATNDLTADSNLIIACKLTTNRVEYFFVDLFAFYLNYQCVVNTWDELKEEIQKHVYEPRFSDVLVYTSVPSMQLFKKETSTFPRLDSGSLVYSIPTKFRSNMLERPFVYSLNYTNYVTAAYTNIKTPNIRNKINRKKSLPDVVLTKVKGRDIDLENTLVSVNGIVGLPVYDSDTKELFIKNGANMLRDAHRTDQNVVLLDFSKILPKDTKLITRKLYECDPDLYFEETVPDYVTHDDIHGSNWAYQSPVTLTSLTSSETSTGGKMVLLKHTLETFLDRRIDYQRRVKFVISFSVEVPNNEFEKIPVLCLGGRLFFLYIDDLTYTPIIDGTTRRLKIVFKVDINTLEKILAANLQHNGVFYGFTSIYRISIGYIISNIFTNKEYNAKFSSDEWKVINQTSKLDIPFISIIQTDKHVAIDRIDQYSTENEKTIRFPKFAQGILINGQTREIVDYTAQKKEADVNVSITPQLPLFISSLEGTARHIDQDGNERNEIPDAMRYDRFTWEHDPFVYKDKYNRRNPSVLLKDIHAFFMLNILFASKERIVLGINKNTKPDEPVVPVYTVGTEPFKYPIRYDTGNKLCVSIKNDYRSVTIGSDTVKRYNAYIQGLPDEFRMYDKAYSYVEDTNPEKADTRRWEYQYTDGSISILRFYASLTVGQITYQNVWTLDYEKQNNVYHILISCSENCATPYNAKLKWAFCNTANVPLEDPDEE